MRLISKLLTAVVLLSAFAVKAQTAEEIIDKHIAAIGGKDVINSIKTQVVENTLSVMGSELPSVTTIVVGKGFKNVATFSGQEIIQVITPTSGWMVNPLQGMTDPQDLPEDQVKAAQSSFEIGGDLYNWKDKGSKVELAGNDKVNGADVYKIKLTNKDGKEVTYYIDKNNYYVVRREANINANGQDITAVSDFSNFKKTDIGLVIPYTTVANQGFEITINVNKVTFNSEIDPKVFDKK